MFVLKLTFLLLTVHTVVFAIPIGVDEEKQQQQHRKNERYNACKLVFQNLRKTPSTQLQERESNRIEETICNLVFALQSAPEVPNPPISTTPIISTSSTQQTPVKSKQHVIVVDDGSNNKENDEDEKKELDPTKPLYEQQLTVWPSDIEDLGDNEDTEVPVIAEQELWYPDEHDHDHEHEQHHHGKIKVVESFHLIYPDGTSEYKLVLSNGMMDYKKIYTKKVGKEKFIIQEGYYTVPVRGKKNKFKIQYYKADEHGYHVHE